MKRKKLNRRNIMFGFETKEEKELKKELEREYMLMRKAIGIIQKYTPKSILFDSYFTRAIIENTHNNIKAKEADDTFKEKIKAAIKEETPLTLVKLDIEEIKNTLGILTLCTKKKRKGKK